MNTYCLRNMTSRALSRDGGGGRLRDWATRTAEFAALCGACGMVGMRKPENLGAIPGRASDTDGAVRLA